MGLKEIYLNEIYKKPFQEIADSPTIKYYTRWKVFDERLHSDRSRSYKSIPNWLNRIIHDIDNKLIITDKARLESPDHYSIRTHTDGDRVLAHLPVHGKMEIIHATRLDIASEISINSKNEIERLLIISLGGDGFTSQHVSINVEQRSNVEVVLVDLGGIGSKSIKTLSIVFNLQPHSRVKLYSISLHKPTPVYSRRIYNISENALLEAHNIYIPSISTRVNEDIYLLGMTSNARVSASAISLGSSWGDILLNVRHKARRSKSIIKARGASLDKSFLALRGIAIVEGSAEWSSTHVDVHSVLLSPDAKASTSPMLEIHTGNVEEAYHSASVHSLEEQHLFYLATRGLSKVDAVKLLLDGVASYSGTLEVLGVNFEELMGEEDTNS